MFRFLRLFAVVVAAVGFTHAASAQTTGTPSEYSVSVSKIELCTEATCATPFVLGAGAQAFNIASAAVGGQLGSYASATNWPVGTMFSHIRVTMSRTIGITGSVTAVPGVGGTGNCATTANASANGTTAGVGTNTGAAALSQSLYVPDVGAFAGQPTAGAYSANGITLSGTSFTWLAALPQSISVTTQPPSLKVSFNVTNALGAFNDGAGGCSMIPQPPSVAVAFN